ncbi:hypothetical protein B1A99_02470 [Cohnella sp. CIP 111063]|jgi:Predicted signal transduction protein with a C-terminal ATPase domain|uniref:sensor histidine kinase n=1 Tax=unclassified Cohnella TaxID=2636738 RepID=UPI000B8BEA2F|nr:MULTISPECIES: sensor histidine kinase [unclassified Cohnella]OXS62738.1 hypothetical protein B1A99_02470 [Cohnella sp. CIP 111063]PRX75011.1 histidine kinase/DNA gyrase B/HSP90-like ATPase [Cohnella sp. SGD-V74]
MRRRGRFAFKLKTKLILLYFLTIFIPLVAIGQILLSVSGSKIIEQTTNITKESSRQTATNIQILLNEYMDIVNRLSFDQTLNNYLNPDRIYEDELESIDAYSLYLKPVTFYDFNYKDTSAQLRIYFLNTTLLQDLETFIFADSDIRETEVFRNAVAGNGEPVWGIKDKFIYVSRSIFNRNGELSAVISVQVLENRLHTLIMERGENRSFITDSEGRVVTANTADYDELATDVRLFSRPETENAFDIKDQATGRSYKVLAEKIGDGKSYPDWRLYTLIPLDRLIDEERQIRNAGLLVIAAGLLLSFGISMLSLDRITSRIKALVKQMQVVKTGNLSKLEDRGSTDEVGALTKSFNAMIESLQQSHYENYEVNLKLKDITIKKQEAELYALQSQINPHFLFNTLESIRMGLHNKGDAETSVIVLNLAKLFRSMLDWQGEFITLGEEIELANKYLSIQKYRFADRLNYVTSLPEQLNKALIPKLTLQPIVENAVVHGIEAISRDGWVEVAVTDEGFGAMEITIADNGAGIAEEKLLRIQEELLSQDMKKSGSIGLKNVQDRLVLHFGERYGIRIESDPGGTRVKVTLPIIYDAKGMR